MRPRSAAQKLQLRRAQLISAQKRIKPVSNGTVPLLSPIQRKPMNKRQYQAAGGGQFKVLYHRSDSRRSAESLLKSQTFGPSSANTRRHDAPHFSGDRAWFAEKMDYGYNGGDDMRTYGRAAVQLKVPTALINKYGVQRRGRHGRRKGINEWYAFPQAELKGIKIYPKHRARRLYP